MFHFASKAIKPTKFVPLNQKNLVDQEVKDMLRNGAIVVSDPKEDKFLSWLFLVEKRDGGNHPVKT